jgi:hypothetical protein
LITAPEARDPELLKKLDAVAGGFCALRFGTVDGSVMKGRRQASPQHLARADGWSVRHDRPAAAAA